MANLKLLMQRCSIELAVRLSKVGLGREKETIPFSQGSADFAQVFHDIFVKNTYLIDEHCLPLSTSYETRKHQILCKRIHAPEMNLSAWESTGYRFIDL